MPDSPDQPNPMGVALGWASRIFAVAIGMVLPGLAGQWLDNRWGTHFLTLVGFMFGLVVGISYLLVMTGAYSSSKRKKGDPP